MGKSVIDAIRSSDCKFDTGDRLRGEFRATDAEPGSREKLAILAHRIQSGLPLWHPDDRHAADGPFPEEV